MKNCTRDKVLLSGFIPPDHLNRKAMQEYKDCGFNLCYMTENHYKVDSPEYFESLKLMEELGLEACVAFYKVQTGKYHEHFKNVDLHDYPAVTMIHAIDEPDDDLIRKVSEIYVPWFNEHYSDIDFFMNTFGGCGTEVSKLDKFNDHINKCITSINDKVTAKNKFFSIDAYPLRTKGYWENFLEASAYIRGLAAGAKRVKETDSIFGGCIQTYAGYMNCRYPNSEADIRFQNFCQFAFGARSLCYFTYMSEETPMYLFRGMVTAKGELTPLYHIVKNINAEINTFEKDYMHFDWLGTTVVDGCKVNDYAEDFAFVRNDIGLDYKDDNVLEVSAERDLLLGCFGDDDNKRAYVITTFAEPSKGLDNKVSITFKNGKKAKINFNGKDEVRDLVDGKLELNMKDGDGAFVIIE